MDTSVLADVARELYFAMLVAYIGGLVISLYHYGLAHSHLTRADKKKKKKLAATKVGGGTALEVPPESEKSDVDHRREAKLRKSGTLTQMLVYLAIALQMAFIVVRGLAANRFPWANLFEYTLLLCFAATVVGAILIASRRSYLVLWPWILTPIIVLLFYAGVHLYVAEAPVVPALRSGWYYIHVTTVSVGASIGLISGVFSLLYLVRLWGERGEEKGSSFSAYLRPLPSAAKLDEFAYKTAVWALPLFGLGILFGAIWANTAWGRPWGWDPKETVSFITWVLYAAYLHARATPGMRGAKAAWINVVALATMIFNLFFINMVVSGLHSYAGLN